MKTNFFLLSILISFFSFAQTARVKGIVLDEYNNPIENVNITFQDNSTVTNKNGFYILNIPSNIKSNLKFSHVSLKPAVITLTLKPNEDYELNLILKSNSEQLGEVVVSNKKNKRVEGIITLSPKSVRLIPGANAGVENILKTLPGVYSNNELSTQYAVRGGNYDENLVYVNEIEVYRPFLIRSGQQEGLSFTNSDLVQNIDFSAGGFQAKFGDKLSSVLDITYRNPVKFGASLEASFLGGSLSMDNVSKNQKWTAITGIRYRDNALLVNSQQTQSNFRPRFADFQSYITFTPNTKWQFGFLGNISQNKYDYQPITRQTNFGTFDEPLAIVVNYEGQEKDKYNTFFGALKTTFTANEQNTYKLITSIYHTTEQEYFDIFADYNIGQVDSSLGSESFGNPKFLQNIGSQLSHARNDLDALIINAEIKGQHKKENGEIEWGLKYTHEDIRDRLSEWEVLNYNGFSINPTGLTPINEQPYVSFTGPLAPFTSARATNYATINRLSGFAQYNYRTKLGNHDIFTNIGIRSQNWQVNSQNSIGKNQITFSPRAQFAIKPDWDTDMLFRLSTGWYHQPPFYRELRDESGQVIPNVKAQQSIHFVLGNDYSFKLWKRPFKLVMEVYYKTQTDVNPYTIDNVRIRYEAKNNAVAYTEGIDVRLNGEFVPGTDSWLSFGYLKTEENIENRGYISRPTDQRLKFGLLFQDYMPVIPALKMYLNLVYNTGLPGGAPSYSDPYLYQFRLRDYRRADLGFSYVLTDRARAKEKNNWVTKFKELAVGLEIFNLFNNQNSITNTWVRNVSTMTQIAIPNYLTSRVFSLKITAKL